MCASGLTSAKRIVWASGGGWRRSSERPAALQTVSAVALALAGLLATLSGAGAEDGPRPGEAFLTHFSGTTVEGGRTVIDTQGAVGSLLDLSTPGEPARGQWWRDVPRRLPIKAGEVGQVFGIAFDDAEQPSIYLSATSAFGLHRGNDNSDWMPGQWGPGGGPGTIWVLDAADNYRPRIFAEVTLNGRVNSGAALGNIAYDRWHKQLFVSDLETGMIHRLSVSDARDLGVFDHGVDGRTRFRDVSGGGAGSLPAVAFDPASTARIDDCPGGSFASHPSCWNYADYRRRVWGLAVRRDPGSDEVRLFYTVWGSDGFGAPGWYTAGDEARNSLWSVRIADDGSFDTSDVRREAILPEMFTDPATVAAKGASRPVSDIAVPRCAATASLVVAERGGVRNLGLAAAEPFATPRESRVLRYRLDGDGRWTLEGRLDVGFADRKSAGEPHLRANAAGGVDFGPGYDASGRFQSDSHDAFLWATGDGLCSADGPCIDSTSAAHDVTSDVTGLQGTPGGELEELQPAGALGPYPASGYATPPRIPDMSYMLDADGEPDATRTGPTMVGDVEIYQDCPRAAGDQEGALEEESIPGGGVPPSGAGGGIDLALEKTGAEHCVAGGTCEFTITITNKGPGTYAGAIGFSEDLLPEFANPAVALSPPWSCNAGDGFIICQHAPTTLEPGQSVSATIGVDINPGLAGAELANCGRIVWPLSPDNQPAQSAFLVEKALADLADPRYPTGPVDGIIDAAGDPVTHASIIAYQTDHGLAPTGAAAPELMEQLFPGSQSLAGDLDPSNDEDCHTVTMLAPFDLALFKAAIGPCLPGGSCQFFDDTINNGPSPYAGPLVLIEEMTSVIGGAGGAVNLGVDAHDTAGQPGVLTCTDEGTTASCHRDVNLIPGEWALMNFRAQVPPIGAGLTELSSCVSVDWAAMGISGDTNSANDRACQTWHFGAILSLPAGAADIAIVGGTECTRGEVCKPTLSLRNVSKQAFSGRIGFRGFLRPGVAIDAVEGWPGCRLGDSSYDCPMRGISLAPGAEAKVNLVLTIPSDFTEERIVNSFSIDWPNRKQGDANASNDAGASVITIRQPQRRPAEYDLALTKRVERQGIYRPGDELAVLIEVRNRGKDAFEGALRLRDFFQSAGGASAQLLAAPDAAQWRCAASAEGISCEERGGKLRLAPGAAISLRLVTRIPAAYRGTSITDCALVQGQSTDGAVERLTSNNRSCVSVPVRREAPEPEVAPLRCPGGWKLLASRSDIPPGWQRQPLKRDGKLAAWCARAPECRANQVLVDGLCRCPSERPFWNGKTCAKCPSSAPHWTGSACVSCKSGSAWSETKRRCVPTAPICRKPFVLNAAGTTCVCPPGLVRKGETCVREPEPEKPIECVDGRVRGNRCICPSGWTLKQRGARVYMCVKPVERIKCVNGTVRNNACICPKDTERRQLATNEFECVARPRIVCQNGKVDDGKCICPKGWTRKRQTRTHFVCTPPKVDVIPPGKLPTDKAVPNLKVIPGAILCPKGTKWVPSAKRCMPIVE